jgi:hypothetical protein
VRVPRHLLMSPQQLMEHVSGNATTTLIVRFLFDFGYPYTCACAMPSVAMTTRSSI